MVSWSLKRRFVYSTGVLSVIAVLLGWWIFVDTYQPPTCFDGKQNGGEDGIDCGGSCQFLCPFQVSEPVVLFSRSFEVTPGVYNAVAYVNNPNLNIGIPSIGYTFKLYDKDNTLITERKGTTFIAAGKVSPIFEGSIVVNGKVPTRTVFELEKSNKWAYVTSSQEDPFVVANTTLDRGSTSPRVSAVLQNTSVNEYKNLEVVVVIFNALKNAIATSRTFVNDLKGKSSAPLVFTWPEPFTRELEACTVPVDAMLLFDTSGSMDDDNADPPEPLTSAKNAVEGFIKNLSSQDRVGLITFATHAQTFSGFSSDHDETTSLVHSIVILPAEESGSTNMGDALLSAVNVLSQDHAPSTAPRKKIIILLTDGIANEPVDPGGEPYAKQYADLAKQDGYTIYTIGLGSNVNDAFLRQIAGNAASPTGAFYQKAATVSDLTNIYKGISDSICERGPAIIEITPRTQDTPL